MQRVALVGGGGEAQFVIVAAVQRAVTGAIAAEQFAQCRRHRQCIGIDFGAYTAACSDVAQVGQQAVGDVDGGMRECTQAQAQGDARGGTQQAQAQGFVVGQQGGGSDVQCALLPQAQCTGSIAESAADPDVIANLCAITTQGLAAGYLAHRGDRQRQRATRGVTADQGDVMLVGQGEKAIGEGIDPVFAGLGQRQRQRAPSRARAHRR